MKKLTLSKTLATLTLVFFLSASSIASSFSFLSGDGETTIAANSGINGKISAVATKLSVETKFSYLRFDVNKFVKHDVPGFIHNSLDYLRFSVNEFVVTNEPANSLPASTEFDYLRFDATRYDAPDNAELSETTSFDYSYLKFDANNYMGSVTDESVEMPADEFDYLRFDVNKYSNTPVADELPLTK